MNDSEILQAILTKLESMDSRLANVEQSQQETNQRLEKVEKLATKTSVLMENDISTNIGLLQDDNSNIMRKLKRMEKLPQAVEEIQSDVSVIKNVVANHSQDIKKLKAQ